MAKGKIKHEKAIELLAFIFKMIGYEVKICEDLIEFRKGERPDLVISKNGYETAIEVGDATSSKLYKLEKRFTNVICWSYPAIEENIKFLYKLSDDLYKIVNDINKDNSKKNNLVKNKSGVTEAIREYFRKRPNIWISKKKLKIELIEYKETAVNRMPDHLVNQGFLIKENRCYKLK